MSTVLDQILDATRERLRRAPPDRAALEARVAARPRPIDALAGLSGRGPHLIAEVKKASPSAGALRPDADVVEVARTYERAGARAISVLTEPDFFGGSLADLASVSEAVALACLRKDFVVDAVQLLEARAAGASLVLLIVAALSDRGLRELVMASRVLELTPLVEVHDEVEIARALEAGARLIGVNNRDLRTLAIDLAVAERLRSRIPEGVVAVAESGIQTRDDLTRLERAGYEVFLVGSSLMRAADPGAALRALLGVRQP